jgi:hypothetical protein
MAIVNETVTVAVCDACDKRTYGDPGQQPKVLTGSVTDYTGDRERSGTWSACGPKHVGPAVAAVIKKATPVRTQPAATASQPVSRPTFGSSTPATNAG